MANLTTHPYYVDQWGEAKFNSQPMAHDLVAALNEIDERGGWRVIRTDEDFFNIPTIISRSNRYGIRLTCGYPNRSRGEATLDLSVVPVYRHRLPDLPTCTFNPLRPIKALAREVLRKIDEPGVVVAEAWLEQIEAEATAKNEHEAFLERLRKLIGAKLGENGSETKYFNFGPLRCSVSGASSIQIMAGTYLDEDEFRRIVEALRPEDPVDVQQTATG